MKKAAHFIMAMIGAGLFILIAVQSWALVKLSAVGNRLCPDIDLGNCWTFALAKWHDHGGELSISLGRLRIGRLRVPHAAWISPDGVRQETEPVVRRKTAKAAWFGLRTLYFRFWVKG